MRALSAEPVDLSHERRVTLRIDKRSLLSEALTLIALIALLTAARSSLADHYYVPSGSMEYTLLPGDRVIVDKTAYGLRIPFTTIDLIDGDPPERGDVAVFDSPRDGTRLKIGRAHV